MTQHKRTMIIKVCGLRDAANVRAVKEAGADWLGFIFYEGSPRVAPLLPPEGLPKDGFRVGVFVNPTFSDILMQEATYRLQAVQLHGRIYPEMCRKLKERGLTVILAIPATGDLNAATKPYCNTRSVDYFLFDTPTPQYGGSGKAYDRSMLHTYTGHVPFLLSGGIGPDSLDELLHFHHDAWAGIDLNSRFELAPGLKDARALHTFIQQLRSLPQQSSKP